MKILLVSQEYPPAVGGAGVVARQNAEELSRQGHAVTVLTRRWGVESPAEGVRVVEAGGLRALWPLAMAWRLKCLGPRRYDAIIINDIGAAVAFIGVPGYRKYFAKSIYYLHGGEVDSILRRPQGFVRWFGLPQKLPGYVGNCKRLVSVSEFLEGYFRDAFDGVISPEKISVVYAGVNSRQFYPSGEDKFKVLREKADLILLSVSRVTREKGYATKLEIFREAIDRGMNLHWVVVGDGSYLPELKQQAEQLGLSGYVTFAGAVTRDSLRYYYSSADLFWLLSDREAFGLAYLEAQLCGCPALGWDAHGVKEAIDNGVTGFLVHSSEDVLDLLLHWEERRPGRDKVMANANRFSLDIQVRRLVEILL